jgi:hypothetical protein
MKKDDRFYKQDGHVRALSIEYGKMMTRQRAIIRELGDDFPLPPGFVWRATGNAADPIAAVPCGPERVNPA